MVPDGLGLEIYADCPLANWTVGEENQIEMPPSRPAPLILLKQLEPPEGTTIGPIHLHGVDLKQASSFYYEGLESTRQWDLSWSPFFSAEGYRHLIGTNV